MLLLVGLGNPNPNNLNNRHNVGFLVIDAINEKFGASVPHGNPTSYPGPGFPVTVD